MGRWRRGLLVGLVVWAVAGAAGCGPVGDGDPGEGNGDPGEGNGDPGEGNGDPGEGNGDPGEGNGDPGEGNGDPGEPTGPVTLTLRLAVPEDAVTSYLMGFGAWNLFHGASVPIGRHWDGGHPSYHTALRFEGVDVPPAATLVSATLSFHPTNEADSSHRLLINVYAEAADDSAPYDPADYEQNRPDQRARTETFVDRWVIRCNATCTEDTEYDCPQRQRDCWHRDVRYVVPHDLAAILQEVVDRPGWVPGGAVSIFLFNAAGQGDSASWTGSRSLTGFDEEKGADAAPELTIVYEVDG